MNLLQWNCAERRSQRTLGICRTAPKSPSNATIRVIRVGHDREDTAGYVRFARWSQRVDATLYPERERWSVRQCVEVIFEALRHQRKQSFGIAGSVASG